VHARGLPDRSPAGSCHVKRGTRSVRANPSHTARVQGRGGAGRDARGTCGGAGGPARTRRPAVSTVPVETGSRDSDGAGTRMMDGRRWSRHRRTGCGMLDSAVWSESGGRTGPSVPACLPRGSRSSAAARPIRHGQGAGTAAGNPAGTAARTWPYSKTRASRSPAGGKRAVPACLPRGSRSSEPESLRGSDPCGPKGTGACRKGRFRRGLVPVGRAAPSGTGACRKGRAVGDRDALCRSTASGFACIAGWRT
jgi:hypothetical protein